MKKTLIAIVLATFCFSVPVFANAGGEITPPAELTSTANNAVPMLGQVRVRLGRRYRRRRFVVRRYRVRRVYRRQRYIIRHRRRR